MEKHEEDLVRKWFQTLGVDEELTEKFLAIKVEDLSLFWAAFYEQQKKSFFVFIDEVEKDTKERSEANLKKVGTAVTGILQMIISALEKVRSENQKTEE